MQSAWSAFRRPSFCAHRQSWRPVSMRQASLTSAVERGIRRASRAGDRGRDDYKPTKRSDAVQGDREVAPGLEVYKPAKRLDAGPRDGLAALTAFSSSVSHRKREGKQRGGLRNRQQAQSLRGRDSSSKSARSFDRHDAPRRSIHNEDRSSSSKPRRSFDRNDAPRKSVNSEDRSSSARPTRSFDRSDAPKKSIFNEARDIPRPLRAFDRNDSSSRSRYTEAGSPMGLSQTSKQRFRSQEIPRESQQRQVINGRERPFKQRSSSRNGDITTEDYSKGVRPQDFKFSEKARSSKKEGPGRVDRSGTEDFPEKADLQEKNGNSRERSSRDEGPTREDSGNASRSSKPYTGPISIPYTTPASEFLYGTFAIIAALKAQRRKFYKLYILRDENTEAGRFSDIEQLARSTSTRVQIVSSDWTSVLNKMSESRPHNGIILEASPLPKRPIRALEEVSSASDPIRLRLDNMSEEELAITGGSSTVERQVHQQRFPFVLLLDRVLDPGNLGAIIRSAYFLGVDAIVMSRSGTAPTSAVTVKASAGAAEAIPLLTANAPLDFVKRSRECGWHFFAAVSPSSESGQVRKERFVTPGKALEEGPCVLVIGGEGEGIARSIMREISGFVGIPQAVRDDSLDVVESLNVSVATALMVQQMLGDTIARRSLRPAADEGSDNVQEEDAEPMKVF